MARLVNKQFNSPIGLYSQQNIQEVLDRDSQILANGAVGIDFRNPAVGKPGNLKNSAVLRMLEEEENRQRNGFAPATKVVTWPPPNDSELDGSYNEEGRVQPQGGPNYQSDLKQSNYSTLPAVQAQKRAPLKPLDVRSPSGSSPLGTPNLNQSPQGFRPSTPAKGWAPVNSPTLSQPSWKQPTQQNNPGPQYQQTTFNQTQQYQQLPQQQQYQTTQQYQYTSSQQYQTSSEQQFKSPLSVQSADQYSPIKQQAPSQYASRPSAPANQPHAPTKYVEPPPTTIPLRPQAPVSQAPPPVYNSQPATATLKVKVSERNLRGDRKWPPESVREKMLREAQNECNSNSFLSLEGGKNLRGDLKWPPETVRQQVDEENRLRIQLAKGPAFRPKRPNKNYTQFFEQHALNNTYPGYKIPPGTQFYRPA